MLFKARDLCGYKLRGSDGVFGKVEEFYFDDRHWTIRYLVADTGSWLADRQVLISPYVLQSVHPDDRTVTVGQTRQQIADSPLLDSDQPVSRQFEERYHGHHRLPPYWGGPCAWGDAADPVADRAQWRDLTPERSFDHHLRSGDDLIGHNLQAADGEIGHVEDLIIDDVTWAICYLVVATRTWWPGKRVLIAPRWIERVSWPEAKVVVGLSREDVRRSPTYDEGALPSLDYVSALGRHYRHRERAALAGTVTRRRPIGWE